MVVVILQNLSQELMLGMMNRFDDIFVISREVKETSTLSGGSQFRKNVFACQRHEIIRRIQLESCPKTSKYPWRVVLEFEVVLCRWGQLIPGTVYSISQVLSHMLIVTYISNENLCLASKSASVNGLSSFAFVLETVKRMPVNMLYAVTQLTWF